MIKSASGSCGSAKPGGCSRAHQNGESVQVSEYGRLIARIVPVAPVTGIPLLDELIEQGRAIPASSSGPIPPTPPRDERDTDVSLSEALEHARDDERY
jgi:antitoxin (DNA-binding transcriptional repressor) of toxin-antitoxin stability system